MSTPSTETTAQPQRQCFPCPKGRAYPSLEHAIAAASEQRKLHPRRAQLANRPWHCCECRQWHLGNPTAHKRQQLPFSECR
jgi:hypothetical protein